MRRTTIVGLLVVAIGALALPGCGPQEYERQYVDEHPLAIEARFVPGADGVAPTVVGVLINRSDRPFLLRAACLQRGEMRPHFQTYVWRDGKPWVNPIPGEQQESLIVIRFAADKTLEPGEEFEVTTYDVTVDPGEYRIWFTLWLPWWYTGYDDRSSDPDPILRSNTIDYTQ